MMDFEETFLVSSLLAERAEVERLTAENERLRHQLEEAQRWQPVEEGYSCTGKNLPGASRNLLNFASLRGNVCLTIFASENHASIVLPDNIRLCRLVEGQPAATEQR